MPYKYKFVKEHIGEKITDPSQLVGWRNRRLEREEGERQRELQRCRDAGEVIPEDEVSAATPVGISTNVTTSRSNSFNLRPVTRAPTSRPMARAAAMVATPDASANTTTALTPDVDAVTIATCVSPSVSAPTTASTAVLPVFITIAVDEEELQDVEMDARLYEFVNDEDVQQQNPEPSITQRDQRPIERHSVETSQPPSVKVGDILHNSQAIAVTADSMTYPGPAPTMVPATAKATASEPVEHLSMGLLDPALFEPVNEYYFAQQALTSHVASQKPLELTVRQESEPISQFTNVQAGNIPANPPIIFEGTTTANPTTTIPEIRLVAAPTIAPVIALDTAPLSAPATTPIIATPAVDVEKKMAAELSEPVNGAGVPEPATVSSAAKESQQMTKPAIGHTEARVNAAYQLVPVVDIVNRLFLQCLAQLQSPTPEIVTSEARLFLARAQENDTEQAVKKAAMTLSSVTQNKIDELTRRSDKFELVSELLKLRLQQVFLQELLK